MNQNEVYRALRELPQCQRINPEDAQRWINAVSEQEPDRLLWRIKRLGSLGGSDIGTLLLETMGKQPPFNNSGTDIINERLMRATPEPTLYHMKKGTRLEDVVIEATLRLYGGRIDQDALDAYASVQNGMPFGLDGNVDFPWITNKGQRVLLDVKVPKAGVVAEESSWEKDFIYSAQLNQYQLLAESKGIQPFEKLANVHLELPPVLTDAYYKRLASGDIEEKNKVVDEMVNLLKHSSPGLRLNFKEQPINPEIEINGQTKRMHDAIREVGAVYWQSVLDGVVPESQSTQNKIFEEDELRVIQAKENELIKCEALQLETEKRITQLKDEIVDFAKRNNTPENLSQSGNYNIKTSSTPNNPAIETFAHRYNVPLDELRSQREKINKSDYDMDSFISAARSAGVCMEDHLKPAPFDTAKVQKAALEHGVSPETVIEPAVRVARSTKKATKEMLVELQISLTEEIDKGLDQLVVPDQQPTESTQARSSARITR